MSVVGLRRRVLTRGQPFGFAGSSGCYVGSTWAGTGQQITLSRRMTPASREERPAVAHRIGKVILPSNSSLAMMTSIRRECTCVRKGICVTTMSKRGFLEIVRREQHEGGGPFRA